VASARENWALNKLDNPALIGEQATFGWDDCLTNMSEGFRPDLVLCNPPFHQGEAITDHIAWQMFLDAFRRLKNGGILHVVGNRHLAYHVKLQRIFKNCTTVASNGKFVILQAQKISKKSQETELEAEQGSEIDASPQAPHPQSALYGKPRA
ncbi:class I SAM-dependent methyltransferase, partial [Shewanella sp. 0m-11]